VWCDLAWEAELLQQLDRVVPADTTKDGRLFVNGLVMQFMDRLRRQPTGAAWHMSTLPILTWYCRTMPPASIQKRRTSLQASAAWEAAIRWKDH
jgi:hypothetical protein